MRETKAVLLIADITGYTRFVTNPTVALRHREEIISTLIEAMLDRAEFPLTVNKLEGDALLAYAEHDADSAAAVANSVLLQTRSLHRAFTQRRDQVQIERQHCNCDACAAVHHLGIKSFLHAGDIAIKQIRQFSEIAGEAVILIHRLLKNQVPDRQYLLLTEQFRSLLPNADAEARAHAEFAEGIGRVNCWLLPA